MRVRSAYTQTTLQTLEALPPAERDEAFGRLSAATAEAVRRAGRLGWVDGAAHVELDDALYATLGRAAYIEHCIELTRTWFDRPLVSAFKVALLGDYSPRGFVGSLRGLARIGGAESQVAIDTKREGLGEVGYLVSWE